MSGKKKLTMIMKQLRAIGRYGINKERLATSWKGNM
jgi:hypothetical protein